MPGPGEQHNAAATSVNPFEEEKPHISEYTAKEIATLSSRLDKQLGPEYISSRPGAAGQKVHYLSADKCINLANDVFGFNGWSSGIMNIQVDFVDEVQSTGKISLGLSVIVRVTLRDGTYHEDVGYGHIENCKGKAAAFEKAKKEGTTDGLKRALRNFGNMLGNCVYDKDYVAKVTKLKVAPSKWDPENLHRHRDYAPAQKYVPYDNIQKPLDHAAAKGKSVAEGRDLKFKDVSGEPEDEFGSDEFDEVDFSDAHGEHPNDISPEPLIKVAGLEKSVHLPKNKPIVIDSTLLTHELQQSGPSPARKPSLVSGSPSGLQKPQTAGLKDQTFSVQALETQNGTEQAQRLLQLPLPQPQRYSMADQPRVCHSPLPQSIPQDVGTTRDFAPMGAKHDNLNCDAASFSDSSGTADHEPPVGFYTARAAESVQMITGVPLKAPAFNPRLESPSIRKTAGVDHTKTKPVDRDMIGAPATAAPLRSNFVNPQADKTRRVGMPVGAASPLQNRNSYKPPQMKRPVETDSAKILRPALGDVTLALVNNPFEAGDNAKRQKISGNMQSAGTNQGMTH